MKNSEVKIIRLKKDELKDEVNWDSKDEVTVEDVKSALEAENLTPEQTEEMYQFIKTFSMLLYNLVELEMRGSQTLIIPLKQKKKNKAA